MMFKLIFNSDDYEKTLKRRRLFAFAMLAVGLIGTVCYFLLVPGSGLNDYAQGFYLGASSGICLGAVILLVRAQYLLSSPDALKKAKIKETDEREKQILHSAFEAAGFVTFFVEAAALFVVLPLSMSAFKALLGVMILYSVVFVAACAWLSKKL